MKNSLVFFLGVVILFCGSCKKDAKQTIVETHLDIAYSDDLGNDLLDTSNSNSFSSDNIRLYTFVNNVKTEVYHPNLTYPHNFMIYKDDSLNQYFLRVFLDQETTLLQLSPNITDTITCTIDNSNGNSIIRKAWYNDDLKWEFGKTGPSFTIVK